MFEWRPILSMLVWPFKMGLLISEGQSGSLKNSLKGSAFTCEAIHKPRLPLAQTRGQRHDAGTSFLRSCLTLPDHHFRSFAGIRHFSFSGRGFLWSHARGRMSFLGYKYPKWKTASGGLLRPEIYFVSFNSQSGFWRSICPLYCCQKQANVPNHKLSSEEWLQESRPGPRQLSGSPAARNPPPFGAVNLHLVAPGVTWPPGHHAQVSAFRGAS